MARYTNNVTLYCVPVMKDGCNNRHMGLRSCMSQGDGLSGSLRFQTLIGTATVMARRVAYHQRTTSLFETKTRRDIIK